MGLCVLCNSDYREIVDVAAVEYSNCRIKTSNSRIKDSNSRIKNSNAGIKNS